MVRLRDGEFIKMQHSCHHVDIIHVRFADDTALVASSKNIPQELVTLIPVEVWKGES